MVFASNVYSKSASKTFTALKHYEGHNDLHYERNVHNDLWGFLMQQHYELPNAANTRSFLMQTLGAS